MSTVAPSVQTRNGHPRDWGNYASLSVLPNASAWAGGLISTTPLEQGDTAFVIGGGSAVCMTAGTPGLLDAVWAIAGSPPTVTSVEIDFTQAHPVYEAEFTVIDALVTPATKIVVSQSGSTATGRVGNDLAWDQILLGAVAGSGQFTITALAVPGPITGRRAVHYQLFN